MFSWVFICIIVAAFSVGVIFAFTLPAWLLITIQAFFILFITCCNFKKK